ncbi:alpha/beta fold hydrolase [Mycobacterium sp. NPDC006124]|uniref:alpha/beta fold hydrolase n=1 Tax=Mycobacterium sp. NPDC006124 TaxID=3156729 RepID=UPI0033A6EDC2
MHTEYRIANPDESGIPLLCIHGVGSSRDAWAGVIERLPADRPIVTYDLRGHGESAKPLGPYSIDDFVSDALALLDNLKFTTVDVIGFSIGGLIAQAVALSAPQRVRRLVLIASIANRTSEERERVMARYTELVEEGPVAIAERSVERWFTPEYLAEHPEARERTIRQMAALDPQAYSAAYRVLATTDLADRLHEIASPTLAIAGSEDVGSPPRMSEFIAKTVADGRLVVIDGVKHNMLTVETDRIGKEITNHVSY